MAKQHERTLLRGDGFVEERVRKSGKVAYVARWNDGTTWRGKVFHTYDEAEDHLRKIGRERRAGTYVPESELTVEQMLEEYLRRGRASGKWTSSTIGLYTSSIENLIVPRIGKLRVIAVTPSRIQTFFDRLGTEYGPPSVSRARTVLSGAFRQAVRLEIIPRNPVTGVEIKEPKRTHPDTWTREEVRRVLDHVQQDAMLSAYYHLALTTGMRPGEIRGLHWEDIDLAKGTVLVHTTTARDESFRTVVSDTTKTKGARTIRIPPSTVTALKRWRPKLAAIQLRAALWHDGGLVFPRRDGLPAPQTSWWRRHKRVCTLAKVTEITLHGTRHTYATLALESGVSIKTVSATLGHKKIEFTLNLYVHSTDAMEEAAAEVMETLVNRA